MHLEHWPAYIIAKFFQGGYRTKMKIRSDENENQVGKFFARLRRAKKGLFSLWSHWKITKKPLNFQKTSIFEKKGSQNFFACAVAGFFSLWKHWKPLKTVKKPLKPLIFGIFFQKPSNFWKKGPQKFFACGGLFFKKVLGRFYESPRSK